MYARKASTLLHKPSKAMHEYKKRGDWLLPVPRIEALRLPYSQERATLDPTPICTTYPYDDRRVCIYTYPWASTVAMSYDCKLKFLRFRFVKNSALSKRLYYDFVPICPPFRIGACCPSARRGFEAVTTATLWEIFRKVSDFFNTSKEIAQKNTEKWDFFYWFYILTQKRGKKALRMGVKKHGVPRLK